MKQEEIAKLSNGQWVEQSRTHVATIEDEDYWRVTQYGKDVFGNTHSQVDKLVIIHKDGTMTGCPLPYQMKITDHLI